MAREVCSRRMGNEFTLKEFLEKYEARLEGMYSSNRNIRAKVRQTLQYLRDDGFIEFVDYRGNYRLIS